jgi:hypothetical protein
MGNISPLTIRIVPESLYSSKFTTGNTGLERFIPGLREEISYG